MRKRLRFTAIDYTDEKTADMRTAEIGAARTDKKELTPLYVRGRVDKPAEDVPHRRLEPARPVQVAPVKRKKVVEKEQKMVRKSKDEGLGR